MDERENAVPEMAFKMDLHVIRAVNSYISI